MSRRLEVELTSKRDDGTYTWRAAGAKQPKGELDGSLLYEGVKVGDVVRVEAEFAVDGVFITAVTPPKSKRAMPEMLEILGSGKDEGAVTTQLVGKRGRGDRDGRGGGRGRDGRGGGRGRGERDGRGRGSRDSRGDGDGGRGRGDRDGRGAGRGRGGRDGDQRGRDRGRPERGRGRPAPPARPKAKRLRPRRVHRDAAMKAVPELQLPLARIVLRDGLPGLRQRVEEQNAAAKAAGQPEIPPKMLEAVGERLLPRLRSAEWRDNAEAALAGIGEIDLRDIRKVVVASENGARDEEGRALAEQLKEGLTARVDAEHGKWLSELNDLLNDGRTVRALRQSSRPPKAGAPLPPDLAARLTEAANASMTADTMPERWGTVLDAVAFSPVRAQVRPQALPTKVSDELRATVKKLSKRVPDIAALFAPKSTQAPPPAAAPIPPPTPVPPATEPSAST
ncbi:MAG: hypothetical protein ACR2P0_08580 [Acidimicrobiales bacterium]